MTKERVKKSDTVNKKIATLLAQLPPDFLVILYQLNPDQNQHWANLRSFYSDLRDCWQAGHSGQNDPLLPLLKSGQITLAYRDYVWHTVDCYNRLWDLVQIAFHYIKPELERLEMTDAAQSAYDLFKSILSGFATEQFDVCLEEHVKLPGRQLSELQTLGLKVFKGEDLNVDKKKRLKRLQGMDWDKEAFIINPALVVTLATCFKKLTRRQTILKSRLEAYYTASFNLLEQEKRLHWHTSQAHM